MDDHELRRSLHELADGAPTLEDADLDMIVAGGMRTRLNRNLATAAAVILTLLASGFVLTQALGESANLVETDVADEPAPVEPDVPEDGAPAPDDIGEDAEDDVEDVEDVGPDSAAEEAADVDTSDSAGDNTADETVEDDGARTGDDTVGDDTADQAAEDTADDSADATASAGSAGSAGSTGAATPGSGSGETSGASAGSTGRLSPLGVGGAFVCRLHDNGILMWNDHNEDLYHVYRSTDGGASYQWRARTTGDVSYTDPQYRPEYRYRVHYVGISQVPCQASATIGCQVTNVGTIEWSDDGREPYRIERSTDGGSTYRELTRVTGANAYTDPAFRSPYRYRISHGGSSTPVPCPESTTFVCLSSGAGRLTWTDTGRGEYFVYRSTDNGATFSWLATVRAGTLYTDTGYRSGYRYEAHHRGMNRVPCRSTDAFACRVNSVGVVTWNGDGRSRYRVLRSTDGGGSYSEIAAVGTSAHLDSGFRPGHRYQVQHDGLPGPYPCQNDTAFVCLTTAAGRLVWTDEGADIYWVYRSVDNGTTYDWHARVDRSPGYTDPDPPSGVRYQVHSDDMPSRVDCLPPP